MAGVLFLGCSNDQYEFEKGVKCYFSFDASIHNTSILLSAVNTGSRGLFCSISRQDLTNANGVTVRHLSLQLSDGKTNEDCKLTTQIELKQTCLLGASNAIYVGRSTLNDGELYAFDRTCPNCYDEGFNKMLQWSNSGQWVTCSRCNRSYDLNNRGCVVSGSDGNKLMRYPASFTGTYLLISN